MAVAARSSSSSLRRTGRCRPLWWRSGVETAVLLSMVTIAVTAVMVRQVSAAEEMPPRVFKQVFFPDGDGYKDTYGRRYDARGDYVVSNGGLYDVYGRPIDAQTGEVTSYDVLDVPPPRVDEDENDSPPGLPEGSRGNEPDPCDVEEKWNRNGINYDASTTADNINTFIGEVIKAVKQARTWKSRFFFTRDYKARKNNEVCTRETAERKIIELASPAEGAEEDQSITQQRLALLDTLQASLQYRFASFLSPAKRARCLYRFGEGIFRRWSRQCDKTTDFWKKLKKVSMCVGDRWKICSQYGQTV